jgi:hypothetical protein
LIWLGCAVETCLNLVRMLRALLLRSGLVASVGS